jgi:hypothetical protein
MPIQQLIITFAKEVKVARLLSFHRREKIIKDSKVWCLLRLIRIYISLYPNLDVKYSVKPTSDFISSVFQYTENARVLRFSLSCSSYQ